jgi:hypothetical protein
MGETTRVTVTLSLGTAEDLGFVSRTLGITRSALIAELLAMDSSELRVASVKGPYRPSLEPALRLRGNSAEVIQARIRELWGNLNAD